MESSVQDTVMRQAFIKAAIADTEKKAPLSEVTKLVASAAKRNVGRATRKQWWAFTRNGNG